MTLSEDLDEKGYAVIENFCQPKLCDNLRERMATLLDNYTETSKPSIFSTLTQQHEKDKYFLDSCDKIHFFWEEDAFDEEGKLLYEKSKAINKVGHGLHLLDDAFRSFSQRNELWSLIKDTGYFKDPQIFQSMYIFKQAKIGGEVLCHQDSTFIHTKPSKVLGVWLALEDATQENGCLWGIPGRYEDEPKQLFILKGDSCTFEPKEGEKYDVDNAVPLPVKKGSLILFHGMFPHFSHPNRSDKSRQALTLHFIDGQNEYLKTNWNQAPHLLKKCLNEALSEASLK